MALVAAVCAPAAVYAIGSLAGRPRATGVAVLTGLFPLALIGVLVARDAITLLAAWEVMSLVPAAAILMADDGAGGRRVVFQYLAITHLGGAGAWIAVLALAERGALGDPAVMAAAGDGTYALIAVAGIVGFGTKAGLVPLHAWLPRAHPAAPGHVSAVMSGAMVSVAVYGLARLALEWLGPPRAGLGLALIGLGSLTAVTGILYALVQDRPKRLLAFSTIENVGLIVAGLGAAALLTARGAPAWAAVALAGALLHAFNHGLLKGLLFLGFSSVDRATGGAAAGGQGGLLRRMPWTAGALMVGALGLAGLPVLNGFAGEWAILQALFELGRAGDPGIALAGALAAAALAVAVALAAMCFAALAGSSLLGRPRTPAAATATDVAPTMRGVAAGLAGACVLLGLAPGLLYRPLSRISGDPATAGGTPGIDVPGSSLPAAAVGLALVALVLVLVRLRGRPAPAAPAWTCGHEPDPGLAWTPVAFATPVLLVLAGPLRATHRTEVVRRGGAVREVRRSGRIPHLFDELVYGPVARRALAAGGYARRLQSGSLRGYLAYLVVLVLVLLVLARSGALG